MKLTTVELLPYADNWQIHRLHFLSDQLLLKGKETQALKLSPFSLRRVFQGGEIVKIDITFNIEPSLQAIWLVKSWWLLSFGLSLMYD